MTMLTATEARTKLYRLLDDISESHNPVHIKGKRHSGIDSQHRFTNNIYYFYYK